jgi:hypothetical protein
MVAYSTPEYEGTGETHKNVQSNTLQETNHLTVIITKEQTMWVTESWQIPVISPRTEIHFQDSYSQASWTPKLF